MGAGSVAQLGAFLSERSDISLVKITPAHLKALSHLLSGSDAAHAARTLVVGGEALVGDALAFWRTHAPNTRYR